jgi:phenylalanyl-tRNA synthetase beta chain
MKLALRTESAIRFEKGVDAAMVEPASDRAAHLLQKLGDAKVTATVKTANAPIQKKEMVFIPQKINDLLGSQFSESEMKEILQKLGFEFDGQNIGVPTWRQNDVVEWPCLAEEVARIAGYQRVTSRLPQGAVVMGAHSELENHKQLFEEVLLAEGFYLVNTFPMIAKGTSFHSGLELKNPITPEESVLRNSLLPSLLRVADYNFNRQVEELRIFEIGKVFFERHEETHGAAFFGGKNVDIFALKGIAENILENVSFRPSDLSHFHPKKQLGLYLLDVCVGAVGIVHPSICKDGGYLSINLSALPKQAKKKYAPIAKFPSTRRDIALLAPKNLTYAEIASAISQHKPKLVTEFFMFDYFESEKIGADKKSLAFAFIYQDPERTLSDDEVNQAHEKFSQLLTQKLPLAIR